MKALLLSLIFTVPTLFAQDAEPAVADATAVAPITLTHLRTENRTTPTISTETPRLSWILESKERGQLQGHYQIQIASGVERLAEEKDLLWDSEKTQSGESHLVKIEAAGLPHDQALYWRVRVWNAADEASPWSEPSNFTLSKEAPAEDPGKEPVIISGFECSDEALNGIFNQARAARLEQFSSIRSGATRQLCARAFAFDAHVAPFYRDYLAALDQAQGEDKIYPAFVPAKEGDAASAPGYSDAAIVIPFALWQMTGDDQYIRGRFENLVDYVGKRREIDTDFSGKPFGTFLHDEADEVSHEFLSITTLALDCRMLGEIATAIPHPPYILQHNAWFDNLRKGFKKEFLNDDDTLKHDTQTARILALRYGVLPNEAKIPMAKGLGDMIRKDGLKTGPFGSSSVLPVLAWTGQNDLAAKIVRDLAGKEKADLVSLAAGTEWMLSFIGGINHQSPGFRAIRIAPYPVGGETPVTWAKAHHDTPYGRLSVSWKMLEDGGFQADVTVPCNTNGIISLPGAEDAVVTESGKPVDESYGARFMRNLDGRKEIIAQPGSYSFLVK